MKIFTILLVVLLLINPFSLQSKSFQQNNIIYVDDDNTEGPWDGSITHPYQFIQDGINNASNGDTVFVFNGIYTELVKIKKQVTLIGEDNSNTILQSIQSNDPTPSFRLLTISADDVTVKNLCFRPYNNNTEYYITAINSKNSDGSLIQHNHIINCKRGILFDENTSSEIVDNHIQFYGEDIAFTALWFVNPINGTELIISNNTLSRYGTGIFFNFFKSAPSRIIVDHNHILSPLGEQSTATFDSGIQFYHTITENYYLQISHNYIIGFDFGFYYNEIFGGGPPMDNSSVQIFINSFNNEDSDLYMLPNSVHSNEELVITKNNFFGEKNGELFFEEIVLYPRMIPFLLLMGIGLIHKSSIEWASNYWINHSADKPKNIPGKKWIFILTYPIAFGYPIHHKDLSPVENPYEI